MRAITVAGKRVSVERVGSGYMGKSEFRWRVGSVSGTDLHVPPGQHQDDVALELLLDFLSGDPSLFPASIQAWARHNSDELALAREDLESGLSTSERLPRAYWGLSRRRPRIPRDSVETRVLREDELRARGYSNPALAALRRNVSGKVAAGEADSIVGIPAVEPAYWGMSRRRSPRRPEDTWKLVGLLAAIGVAGGLLSVAVGGPKSPTPVPAQGGGGPNGHVPRHHEILFR